MSNQTQQLPDDLRITEVTESNTPLQELQGVECAQIKDKELGFAGNRDDGTVYVKNVSGSKAWVSASRLPSEDEESFDQDFLVVGYHTEEVNHQLSFASDVVVAPVEYMPFFGDGTLNDIDVFTNEDIPNHYTINKFDIETYIDEKYTGYIHTTTQNGNITVTNGGTINAEYSIEDGRMTVKGEYHGVEFDEEYPASKNHFRNTLTEHLHLNK